MLSRKNRLTRSQFSEYFSTGKRLHSPLFTLVYKEDNSFKASAVISKKIAKTAVARNKFRRRVYAVFESYAREHPLCGIFICIARPGAGNATFDLIRKELLSLIHKISVLG
jgi:ribonuclease P protein component